MQQFTIPVPLGLFATIDVFRLLAVHGQAAISYFDENGEANSEIVQIALPGKINNNQEFTGKLLPDVIDIFKWFTSEMKKSIVHTPHLQYTYGKLFL